MIDWEYEPTLDDVNICYKPMSEGVVYDWEYELMLKIWPKIKEKIDNDYYG